MLDPSGPQASRLEPPLQIPTAVYGAGKEDYPFVVEVCSKKEVSQSKVSIPAEYFPVSGALNLSKRKGLCINKEYKTTLADALLEVKNFRAIWRCEESDVLNLPTRTEKQNEYVWKKIKKYGKAGLKTNDWIRNEEFIRQGFSKRISTIPTPRKSHKQGQHVIV